MKKTTLLLLGLICILFATTAQAQQAPEQARNFQINATHTGASVENLKPPLAQRWVVQFGEPISYPIIADGMVYVTVRSSIGFGTRLFALNAIDGSTVWARSVGGAPNWSASCYENGRVFTLSSDGQLRAFNAQTGNSFWIRRLGTTSSLFDAPPTVFEGVIYVSGDQNVFAVNADNGAVKWTTGVLNDHPSSPAVTNEGVYVSDSCSNVYKFDPATGGIIWWFAQNCFGGGGRTPALFDGRLYVRDSLHDFFDMIFDSQTGNLIGNFNAKNTPAFSGSRGFFLNGSKFFGGSGFIEARDVNTMDFLWGFEGDGGLQSGLLVVNDYVYVGSFSGNLYAVNATTGEQVWVTYTGDSIPSVDEQNISQPVTGFAAGEGLLVVPTNTSLVAYENDTTPPTLTWGERDPFQGFWNNTPVNLPFTTEDSGTGIQSSNPESPLLFTTEGIGLTQQVTVTDNAGNTATFTSPEINIDLTPPTTVAIIPGASQTDEWFAGPVSVTLEASDNLSGVWSIWYIVDGGFPQSQLGPIEISGDGTHTIEYWSEDFAGNAEIHQTRIVRIDSTAPVTQASVSGTTGANNWYLSAVQVSLSASDNFSGVRGSFYRINGGADQNYTGPFVISASGTHTVEYWSIDNLNNREVTRVLVVKIDPVAPVVSVTSNPATASKSPRPVTVTISGNASDAVSGVSNANFNVIDEYGVTQPSGAVTLQANGNYSFTLTLPATRNGPDKDGHLYTIVVSAFDQAGNSATATATLRIN